ncbi:MAG: 16S rRNA (guanine(527)-N(7))-methyltransferase RsmG [Bacteroidetes bacterium]|nr:16S rRNA (guanine(527)-N(7))-methyltransferase RsmG [Bacteroidota bacterium]MBV6461458.1 Ribosomal RNA small subunit methyltransferase G [Flavobacteriales bacterium]WKZ76546.1 MAG: 16S rRNA (guanine(527)-N(7))-methyltransferase RsmG [Vicingaceae bacterium]NOG94227.1 16S rRNA (guanine(527)-N(7))-methyltransferase RsmG [Bacteroidota bacterium]CAG0956554.1 Ribosomal RNA small subunit methyltransferase G [Flavobacteriales bacterium]
MPDNISIILHYFPELNSQQKSQFSALKDIYAEWNSKINVISRKDMEYFYTHHVLHSLGIAKTVKFSNHSKILDLGTGGGFPGIPLAILFPEAYFHLVDSIGKKIKVVNEVIHALNLTNAQTSHCRVEQINEKYNFIVSRAVAPVKDITNWSKNKFLKSSAGYVSNGYFLLKGGNLTEEIIEAKAKARFYNLSDYFKEDFFENKKVVYIKG